MQSWDLILGAIMGTSGSGIIAVVWNIIKESKAGKLINEETSIGQMRYLKDEAEKKQQKLERQLVAYKQAYADIWRAYTIGPPPGELNFPFIPGGLTDDD